MAKGHKDGDPVVIKKYANRRLYNTGSSSYITLDDLAAMVRAGTDFSVVDAKSGDDITHAILTQIIVEQENSGEQMLPVSFLRDIIGMYGHSMGGMMPTYLEASMQAFRKNREELQEAFTKGVGTSPFAAIAETNMKLMQNAAAAFMPKPQSRSQPQSRPEEPALSDDLAALREQMARMQKKLDELG